MLDFPSVIRTIANKWSITREVFRAPSVRIEMFGDQLARDSFHSFTKPHPRFRVIPFKRWGVALLRLPETHDEYLAGSAKELLRRKRKRALGRGFRFRPFVAGDHVEEIVAIGTSMELRQGQVMGRHYTDHVQVKAFAERFPNLYGVFSAEGVLRAYAHPVDVGDAFYFNRILGHGDDLEDGVVWLLLSEVVGHYIERRRAQGFPTWANYDTFWGASEGLRFFKRRVGFQPYRVEWIWACDR